MIFVTVRHPGQECHIIDDRSHQAVPTPQRHCRFAAHTRREVEDAICRGPAAGRLLRSLRNCSPPPDQTASSCSYASGVCHDPFAECACVPSSLNCPPASPASEWRRTRQRVPPSSITKLTQHHGALDRLDSLSAPPLRAPFLHRCGAAAFILSSGARHHPHFGDALSAIPTTSWSPFSSY